MFIILLLVNLSNNVFIRYNGTICFTMLFTQREITIIGISNEFEQISLFY